MKVLSQAGIPSKQWQLHNRPETNYIQSYLLAECSYDMNSGTEFRVVHAWRPNDPKLSDKIGSTLRGESIYQVVLIPKLFS